MTQSLSICYLCGDAEDAPGSWFLDLAVLAMVIVTILGVKQQMKELPYCLSLQKLQWTRPTYSLDCRTKNWALYPLIKSSEYLPILCLCQHAYLQSSALITVMWLSKVRRHSFKKTCRIFREGEWNKMGNGSGTKAVKKKEIRAGRMETEAHLWSCIASLWVQWCAITSALG